jgi:hypothetical protein
MRAGSGPPRVSARAACQAPVSATSGLGQAVLKRRKPDVRFAPMSKHRQVTSAGPKSATADPKHLGARIGITSVPPYLGLGHDRSPARAHDRAGRRHLARR